MKRKKIVLLIIILIIILISGLKNLFADDSSLITGTVKTDDDIPIQGVLVWISNSTIKDKTDSSGKYILAPGKIGTYTINAHFKNFETEMKTVKIIKDQITNIDFILKPKRFSYEISVRGKVPKLMSASENIGVVSIKPDQIANLPTLGEQDVFRSIQLMPGVSASSESSSGLYVRGGKPEENLILYDGFTIYHVDHFFGIFSAFNANAIEEVKLYKGGFESKFGGRISSVMEIEGKTGDIDGFKFGGGINFLSLNAFAEIPLGQKGAIYLAGRQSFQSPLYNTILDIYHDTETKTNSTQTNSNRMGGGRFAGMFDSEPTSYFYDLNAKVIYKPSQKDVLSLSIYNGKDDLDNSREIELPSFMAERAAERGFSIDVDGAYIDLNDWGNTGSSFNWLRQWNDKFSTNFTIAYSNYFNDLQKKSSMKMTRTDENEEEPIEEEVTARNTERISSEYNKLRDMTFRINNTINLNNNRLEFGVQIVKNKIDYNYAISNFVSTEDDSDETFEPENLLDIIGSGTQYSGFIQDKITLFDKLTLTPGLRLTYFDKTESFYIEPRFSLILNLSEKIKFKGSWGNYYQYVNNLIREDVMQGDKDFWILADGQNVPVSSATHYIAGISFETKKFLFDFEIYYKNLENLSQYSFRNTPGFDNREEIDYMDHFYHGTGYAKGMEFLIQKKYGRYTGWVCYTLGKVEHDFPDLNETSFPASHDVTHEFKMVNSFKIKKWTLSSTFIYASGKPYTEPINAYQETVFNERRNRDMLINVIEYGPKNGSRLPNYHRLDFSLTYDFKIGPAKINTGVSVFNLYNNKNIWRKEYDVVDNELIETDVNYLGITPSVFFKIRF